jgi:hypothetical protein
MTNHLFPALCRSYGLPEPAAEYRFSERRWKFDWAWPDRKLALEVEGGLWIMGRHNRPVGMQKDFEKYNAAACLGWRVLKCTPRTLCTSATLETIKEAIAAA